MLALWFSLISVNSTTALLSPWPATLGITLGFRSKIQIITLTEITLVSPESFFHFSPTLPQLRWNPWHYSSFLNSLKAFTAIYRTTSSLRESFQKTRPNVTHSLELLKSHVKKVQILTIAYRTTNLTLSPSSLNSAVTVYSYQVPASSHKGFPWVPEGHLSSLLAFHLLSLPFGSLFSQLDTQIIPSGLLCK